MKTILVPTDFSQCSAAAYSYAVMLAEKTNSSIVLLHVLDIPQPSLSTTNGSENTADARYMMEMMKLTRYRMKKVRDGKTFKNADVKEVIEVGTMYQKTLAAAKKHKADIIVMGTHGSGGFHERFIGSNAEKIVRSAEIPVFTIKETLSSPRIKTIMLATDFSEEAELILPAVNDIAEALKARIVLTKVITPVRFETSEETGRQMQQFRDKSKMYNYSTFVYYANTKEDGIKKAAIALNADIIAMGTHGRHGLARMFEGSIAEKVVNHAALPVFTINFHRRRLIKRANKLATRKLEKTYDSDYLYQIPSI